MHGSVTLPLRPRCDRPDFKRISIALAALGPVSNQTKHSAILRSEYRHYSRTAAEAYAWRPFCMQFRLWEKERETKGQAAVTRSANELFASEDFWRGVAAPKGRRIVAIEGEVVALSVRGGELRLWDGLDEVWFAPGDRMPSAIVIDGFGGSLSLAAIRFCKDHKIALVFLDWPEDLFTFMGPPPEAHATVIRWQVAADAANAARAIIARKIEHARAAGRLTALEAERFGGTLHSAQTVSAIMTVEARMAKVYWSRFDIRLVPRKGARLPAHWQTIAGRTSDLGPGSKRATRPINAMLNYAYSVELGRLASALHAKGACLAIGFLHADKPGRASLAYDVLEPLRPIIDSAVAKWIASHKFAPGDFIRMRTGGVRIGGSLSKCFAQDIALPQAAIERAAGFVLWLL